MNLNFLCCIGAELKNSVQQTTRMTQVYLYRAFEEETIADMLATGFFNDALGIIRQDDLLLLYSPNETPGKYVYARVSSVGRDGVEIEKVNIRAEEITVDTTGYTNLSGSNLQQVLNNLDTLLTTMNNAFVKKDGTSIMSAPLKFVGGSLRGAIGPTFGGVEFYTLNNDSPTYSLVALGRFSTNGFLPHNDNTYDIGSTARYWKDAYIGRVITSVLNNGFDIAVPVTNSADTLALKSEVDNAANSGRMITDQGVWFAKMYAATVPPAADDGTNYADFSQTDGDGNPIIVIYERQSGAWVQSETITPPAAYDGYVPVTKKIWDIIEQTGQNGGRVLWNHQSKQFTPYPSVVSFENIEITGDSTVDMPLNPGTQQIVNKNYVDSAIAASAATKANVGMDNLTSVGKNIANWSNNVTNCITEIPQNIKLELDTATHTVTLKAGSKVYVPNGVGVFDEIIIANDLTNVSTETATNTQFLIYNGTTIFPYLSTAVYSGATQPTTTSQYAVWYDTTNNLIKTTADTGATWQSTGSSLPIAIISKTNGNWTSIDKVFNGFGYIGSTVFALPGVKGLIPNGRNADGTPKSTEFSLTSVITKNITLAGTFRGVGIWLTATSISPVIVGNIEGYGVWAYHEDINFNKSETGIEQVCLAGIFDISSSVISNFTPKQVFHAVDYNDTGFIANQAMPSNKYIDIATSLPASNTIYTAPADGYFVFVMNLAVNTYFAIFSNASTNVADLLDIAHAAIAQNYVIRVPIARGGIIKIQYSGTPTFRAARFYYAQGSI